MATETTAAAFDRVRGMIEGFWSAQVINTAAELRIPDALGDEARDYTLVARTVESHGPSVLRLLRAMCALDLCTQVGDSQFQLTAAGQLLRSDATDSLRGRAMHVGGALWHAFGHLAETVRTGQPPASLLTGPAGFEALQRDPARLHAFHMSMAETSRRAARDVLAAYDFGRFRRIVDIGGGYGSLLCRILETVAHLQGSVFDLPYLESGATAYMQKAGVAGRTNFVGGNFFEAVPAGADCYLLKYILHDWDDERAEKILSNCREAAGAAGTICIVERIVPERIRPSSDDCEILRGDLTMLPHGGVERTRGQYEALLRKSGLHLSRVVSTPGVFSVLEARAV